MRHLRGREGGGRGSRLQLRALDIGETLGNVARTRGEFDILLPPLSGIGVKRVLL
jgi:hypothetical protein